MFRKLIIFSILKKDEVTTHRNENLKYPVAKSCNIT